jgi:hypothetical protein
MRTHSWAVLLLCLCPALGGAMESPSPDSESPLPASSAMWRYLTRLEATGLALLPDGGVDGVESYVQLTPMVVAAEGESFGLNLGAPVRLRLEVRRQHGGFRQGYFGPDYELVRLRAPGTSGLPLVQAPFPNGFSTYAEARVARDGVRLGGLPQRHLSFSLGAEVFGWGRVDVDGRLAAQLANGNLEVALSGLAVDNAR